MLIFIKLTLGLLLPTMAGYSFLLVLLKRNYLPFFFHVAIGYGLGMGFIALWMFLLSLINVPYNLKSIGLPMIVFSMICFYITRHHNDQKIKTQWTITTENFFLTHVLNIFFLVSIIVTLFYVFWRSLAIPIASYDALATVAYKSKVIYFQKTLPNLNSFPHRSYPLMIPFNQAWLGYVLGYWSDVYIKVIFPLTLCAYATIQFYFLRIITDKNWALFGVFLLLASNLLTYHATIAYRDLFLMYFNCSTIILLILWHQTRLSGLLWSSAIFAGLASFTKLEGSIYLIVYMLIFFFINGPLSLQERKDRIKNTFTFLLPSLGICIGYHIYKYFVIFMDNTTGVMEKMEIEFSFSKLTLIPEILQKIITDLFYTNNWGVVWLALLFSSVYVFKKIKLDSVKILLLSLFSIVALFIINGLLTTNYIWLFGTKATTTLSRLIIHFYPLATLLIILLNYPDKEEV